MVQTEEQIKKVLRQVKKPTQTLFDDVRKRKALESQVGLTAEKLDIAQEQALALKALELAQKQSKSIITRRG